jgi:hypothetical protein
MNGFKYSAFGIELKEHVSTIQIPINLQYKFGDPGDNRIFIGIGPFVGLNVGGKVEASTNFLGIPFSFNESLRIGSDSTDHIRRFDAGFGLNAGYQLSGGVYFRAAFQLGLINLRPNGDENNFQRSSHFGISVGYLFGEKENASTNTETNVVPAVQ